QKNDKKDRFYGLM
uniref:Tachykinin-like peptide-XI n=2 Tax=Phoneutria TaxID=6917 RepID=TLP11_PHONI|nr:RecName: Full=Tachykinin-like peptide-XI; AltName: Full=P.nigriventer tachykinin peptides XI; Short=PnTkP-XI; AltName: Full=U29-ctenitoxin-Pn1k; Short=U29-CNTX-Pn1k [Phoneutria nigriventer]